MWRRLLLILTAALAPVLLALAPAHPAVAASCLGDTCTGQDPVAAGCDLDTAKTTLDQVSDLGGGRWVQLRYSPLCNAMWARLVLSGDGPVTYDWTGFIEAKSLRPGGSPIRLGATLATGWTLMTDSALTSRACIQAPNEPYRCTAWWLPRISGTRALLIPQGEASSLDTTCPYGERYWASGVSGSGSFGATWYVSGLVPWTWYNLSADVRCDGTATSVLYDVDDPSGARTWFLVNQLVTDWAPLGTWETDGNGNLTVRISNGKSPNGQVVVAGLNVTGTGRHCPCPT